MALEVDDLCVYDVYMYELVDCITSKPTAHVYHELKCIINKGLVHFLIRKLTFGLLSDNAAMHLLQDDSGPSLVLWPSFSALLPFLPPLPSNVEVNRS